MSTLTVKPSEKYLTKAYVTIAIIVAVILISGLLFGALLTLDETIGSEAIRWSFWISLGLNLLWGIPAVLLMPPYARSLRYEIHDEEVIMHVGIITRSIKHVPFRTVTNITVKRGPLDRLFGIGSLDIQTAGISGTNQAEQRLVGLEEPQAIYELVGQVLHRFRGAMGPTTTDVDDVLPNDANDQDLLKLILEEVQGIREKLEH